MISDCPAGNAGLRIETASHRCLLAELATFNQGLSYVEGRIENLYRIV